MWIMILFDLPIVTRNEKKEYVQFRDWLIKDGFIMFQESIYVRHCQSMEDTDKHIKRVENFIPSAGHIAILYLTDKQYGNMRIYHGATRRKVISTVQQLELF